MKKRIVSIITALALCLSLCPAWAFAAEGDGPTVAVAVVTKEDGSTTSIVDADALVAAFKDSGYAGATIKLLTDVEIPDSPADALTISIACTLDLNECSITSVRAEGTIQVSTTYYSDIVTIQGTGAVANTGAGPALKIDDGHVILKGGTYSATQGDAIIISDSSYLTMGDLLDNQEGTDPWNAYLDSSDTPITGKLDEKTLSGPVTVGQCMPHSFSDVFVPDEDTDTHSNPCLACGYKRDTEDCTFDWTPFDDSQWHDGVCTVCKREKRADHNYTPWANGKRTCIDCGYEEHLVAKVDNGGTKTYYATVEEAISEAVTNGGAVTVLANATVGFFTEATPVDLAVAAGAELTLSADCQIAVSTLENNGKIVNNGTIDLPSTAALTNNGSIVNNGTITLPKAGTAASDIGNLKLTGTGTVRVSDGTTAEVYDNTGTPLTGDLDFTQGTNISGEGYDWNAAANTLTLTNAVIGGTVTLPPNVAVTIEAVGECSIHTLVIAGSASDKMMLTFNGEEGSTLTVQQRINLSGGDANTLTVEKGATVIANGGIVSGSSGGVNSIVTINGTLTAKGDSDTAISAGKVVVGKGGKLSVSGIRGVQLNGMNSGGSGSDFTGVFTVVRGGSFYANCTEFNVAVYAGADTFPDGSNADKAIIIPEDHMPGDCRVEKGINAVNFIKISTGNVFTGPMTIHEKHTYDSTWKFDSAQHWRECTYEGCSKRDGEASHNPIWQYNTDGHWQECSVCDYTTTPEAHTYGNTWQSDANNHWHACITCGAVTDRAAHTYVDGTCSVCGHKQPDPPSPPIHRHVWSSNWSSDAANHWIRCITCGAVKDRQAHIYDDDQDAVCNVCGYERTVEPPAHIHNWSEEWSSDSGHHWHECTAAGCDLADNSQKDGYGEHIYDDGQDAVCNVCGYERTVEPPAHIHSWSEEWSSDSGHHWHECTAAGCDLADNSQKGSYGEHVYDGDQDAVCNDCGYERTVEHRHSWSEGWSSDSGHHWHECTAAGCDLTDSSQKDGYGPHIFDNAWDAGCNTCGYQRLLPTPSRPSGGGSSIRAYAIKVEKSEHGKVTSSRAYAASGTTIALTVTPDAGCVLLELTVTDSQGNGISLTEKNTFTMPGRDVTVKASFAPVPVEPQEQPCGGGDGCPSGAYADLRTGAWYHEAVDYAIREGLLTGYGSGTFKPDDNLSRAQLAQILYNMAGRPVVKAGSRFADVAADSWCADAVAWAAAQGIIDGYGEGRFGPDDSITREQMAAMLWRYAGSPAATDKELHFSDAAQAGGWSLDALRWAVENGILHGNGDGTLAPKGLTSRAEAAQMLLNLADK